MPKLTDTQLVILSAGARRKDGAVLPLPRSLKVNKAAATTVLRSHRETRIGPYRGEQPMSVTTVDAGCPTNREENK